MGRWPELTLAGSASRGTSVAGALPPAIHCIPSGDGKTEIKCGNRSAKVNQLRRCGNGPGGKFNSHHYDAHRPHGVDLNFRPYGHFRIESDGAESAGLRRLHPRGQCRSDDSGHDSRELRADFSVFPLLLAGGTFLGHVVARNRAVSGGVQPMRICIQGQADAAKVIAGYLRSQGYLLTDQRPNYTVYLSERETPVIDGAPSIVIERGGLPARSPHHLSPVPSHQSAHRAGARGRHPERS